jgi:hypothetical protein
MSNQKKDKTFTELYEKALKEGEKRFGSACNHSETKDGICLKCLRKVLDDDKVV